MRFMDSEAGDVFCKESHKADIHTHRHTHTHAVLFRNIQGSCLILVNKATGMSVLIQLSALLAALPPGNE